MSIPSQKSEETLVKVIKLVSCGDKQAEDFLVKMFHVARAWDNIVDEDAPVSTHYQDYILSTLAFDFGRNEFYTKHRDRIETVFMIGWNAWSDANLWAKDEEALKRSAAWFIRDYITEVVYLVAWLKGGRSFLRQVSPKVRHFFLCALVEPKEDLEAINGGLGFNRTDHIDTKA